MKLSEMKQILSGGGIQLTRSLGQNFLHDANQLRRIVAAAELAKSDKVLEIGPGLGPLTELLVARAGEVLAIEKDARLVEVLRSRFEAALASRPREDASASEMSQTPGLRLIHDDALEFLKRERRDWSQWKLVANLPYSVASPILVELALDPARPERLVATLQLEVAKRLMAGPGDPDYGVLTLLVQLDYEPLSWFKIPAGCFFPEPDVDSACVCLRRRVQTLLAPDQKETFARIVKRSFSQRRKMMLKLLKEDWPVRDLDQALARVHLPPQARGETVSVEQFVQLTRELAAHTPTTPTAARC
jgi:16S rRNA (adenine1518-N6/adenine1519-N6)-dimethyltransferase